MARPLLLRVAMNGIAIHRTTVIPREQQSDAALVVDPIAIERGQNDASIGAHESAVQNVVVRAQDVPLKPHPIVSSVRSHHWPNNAAIDLTRRVSGPTPDLGQILLGDGREKITLEGTLGAGGMGVVYSGFHRILNQPVVVKVIRSEYVHVPELVARFQREAEILAAVDSLGVVKLLDCDVTTAGLPYMVLERLQGQDLSDLVDARGKLPAPEALAIVLEAAQALAPLHARGIVHRDVKPDNIYLHTNGSGARQVKLLDFGVALATKKRAQLTLPGMTMGSLHYMSPEQLKDCRGVTPATDVWALGVVLFQLISGELPFRGVLSEAEYTSQVLTQNALNLRAVAPEVTKDLARIVAKCLQTDPWKRYADASQLASALSQYITQQRNKLRLLKVASIRPKPKSSNPSGANPAAEPKRGWSKLQLAAAGVVTGIALGHFMPDGVRTELSRATLSAVAAPLQLLGH